MDDLYAEFHHTEIFSKLPENERISLLKKASHKKLQKKEYLAHQGDVWPYVMFVISGQIRWAMLATSGKEHLMFNLSKNQAFWAHSVFDGDSLPASLYAARKSEVLLWDRETILDYLRRYPDAMWETTKMLTKTMRHAREIIYGLAFQPVAGRLASLLLEQHNQSSSTQIKRDFTLNEVATRVAATPEVVCRLLHQFQEDGILEITRARINIQDMKALEKAKKE